MSRIKQIKKRMVEVAKRIGELDTVYHRTKASIDPDDRTNNKRLGLNQCARIRRQIDELKKEEQKLKEEAYKF